MCQSFHNGLKSNMIVLSLLSSFLVQRDKLYINKLLIPVYHFIFRCLHGNMLYSMRSAQPVRTTGICIQLFVRICHISLVTFSCHFCCTSLSLSLSLFLLLFIPYYSIRHEPTILTLFQMALNRRQKSAYQH